MICSVLFGSRIGVGFEFLDSLARPSRSFRLVRLVAGLLARLYACPSSCAPVCLSVPRLLCMYVGLYPPNFCPLRERENVWVCVYVDM